jgi:NADH-quinone oxidoreductase subunit J
VTTAVFSFYLFSVVLLFAAVMVISARNPVHSVLWLIVAFFNAAGLFILLGAEFLAMLLVIVYVGAVAVLFLFVVMMLDIDFAQMREGFQRYAPIGAIIGGILLLELFMVVTVWRVAPEAATLRLNPNPEGVTNAEALGRILYTDYIYLFQGSGVILLVAMIGAIVLTHRDRAGTKRQDIAVQVARAGTVSMRAVPTGAGLKEIGIERPPSPDAEKPKQVEHHGHGGHH